MVSVCDPVRRSVWSRACDRPAGTYPRPVRDRRLWAATRAGGGRPSSVSAQRRRVAGWSALVALVVAALLVTPLTPAVGEDLRVSVCRSTGGSCGYRPPATRCAVLARDAGLASAATTVRDSVAADGLGTLKQLDGSAAVAVPRVDGLGALAARRLGLAATGPGQGVVLGQVHRFGRHDDADAWVDRYRQADVAVTSAVVGPRADGVHDGVRSVVRALGFGDPGAQRQPDGVLLDMAAQVVASAAFGQSSGPYIHPLIGPRPRVTLEANGRSSTTGALDVGSTQAEAAGSLASRLGLLGTGTWTVTSDAAASPVTLTVTGEAEQTPDGTFVASASLVRLRERGSTIGGGTARADADRLRGERTQQAVVLDLRSATNRSAFERVFLTAGPMVLLRSAPTRTLPRKAGVATDTPRAEQAVQALVDRFSADAVYVRTRTRTSPPPTAGQAQGGDAAGVRPGTETTLIEAFSVDFAVPASRLSPLPGCSS